MILNGLVKLEIQDLTCFQLLIQRVRSLITYIAIIVIFSYKDYKSVATHWDRLVYGDRRFSTSVRLANSSCNQVRDTVALYNHPKDIALLFHSLARAGVRDEVGAYSLGSF